MAMNEKQMTLALNPLIVNQTLVTSAFRFTLYIQNS